MASFNFNHLTFPMQAVPQQSTLPYYHLTDCCDIRLSDLKNLLLMKRVPFKTAATHKRCTVLLNRAERGLMSYEDCTIEELQRFLQQRGYAREPPSQHTRLVRLLEKMDNRAKFERFLELPPELRNAVYGFHLGGFGGVAGDEARARQQERLACAGEESGGAAALFGFEAVETGGDAAV